MAILFHVTSAVGFWGLHWARMAQGRSLVLAAGWGAEGRRGPPLSPPCGWSVLLGLLSALVAGFQECKAFLKAFLRLRPGNLRLRLLPHVRLKLVTGIT